MMKPKPKKSRPQWRSEAGSEDNISGENPRAPQATEDERLRAALKLYANKKLWNEAGQFMDCKNDEGAEIARNALIRQ